MCQSGRRRPRWRSSATVENWFHRCPTAGLILRPQTGSAAPKMRYRFCVQKMDAISVPRNARRNIFFSWRPDLRYRNRVHFLVPKLGPQTAKLKPVFWVQWSQFSGPNGTSFLGQRDPVFWLQWNQFSGPNGTSFLAQMEPTFWHQRVSIFRSRSIRF